MPSGGKAADRLIEGVGIEGAGHGYSEAAVGGDEAVLCHQISKRLNVGLSEDGGFGRAYSVTATDGGGPGEGGFERIANGADPVVRGCAQYALEHGGKHVGVFMTVDVRNLDAGLKETSDLSGGFDFNLM